VVKKFDDLFSRFSPSIFAYIILLDVYVKISSIHEYIYMIIHVSYIRRLLPAV